MKKVTLIMPLHDWESCNLPNNVIVHAIDQIGYYVYIDCDIDKYDIVHKELIAMYSHELEPA